MMHWNLNKCVALWTIELAFHWCMHCLASEMRMAWSEASYRAAPKKKSKFHIKFCYKPLDLFKILTIVNPTCNNIPKMDRNKIAVCDKVKKAAQMLPLTPIILTMPQPVMVSGGFSNHESQDKGTQMKV